MKPYSEYKEIGLDFLDSLPAHWDIRKLKFLSLVNFSNVDKHSFEEEIPVRLCNYVDVYKNDFIKPDMEFMNATASQSEIEKFVLRKGDVLITKDSESWEDIAIPALVTENMDDVLCGYHLAQIRPSSISGNFLFWVLCSSTLNDQYKVEAHGITRYGLGKDSIENSVIPIPSSSEQQAIADFLDCKTAQIDTLIEKKQRQIDLLQEQRTALINHAVTKGLNPDPPMKDSGVEWLGEIPSRWEVVRVKHLAESMISGPFGSSLTKDMYTSKGYRVYGQEQVIPADFSIGDYYISEEKYIEMQRYAVSTGDVLISCVGTFGKIAVVPEGIEPGIINPRLIKITPNRKAILSEYLGEVLSSKVTFDQLEEVNRGGTMGLINLGLLSDILIPVPPVDEQLEIKSFVEQTKANISKSHQNIARMLELLQEYRTALISEAVTGKIDVR
jgi:type I restriction enzyme, S subunit